MITDPYVPQVGHLVKTPHGPTVWVISWCNPDSEFCSVLPRNGGEVLTRKDNLTFLADRSAEWEALFQLDTPTP